MSKTQIRFASLWLALSFAVAAMTSVTCVSEHTQDCGDGLVCPQGTECALNENVCIRDACGDGVVDTGEICDDGNIQDGDGCSATCVSREECGNGITDDAEAMDDPEVCDDGNTDDGDECSMNCLSLEVCQNGILDTEIDTPEICDDGNNDDVDDCNNACTSNNECGNGIQDENVGEACDDAHAPGGCSDDCTGGVDCHDSVLDPGEECDDGDVDQTNGCVDFDSNNDGDVDDPTDQCRTARCGDGLVRDDGTIFDELCDTAGDSDTCNANCTVPECGDAIVNPEFTPPDVTDDPNPFALPEQCDNGATGADSAECTHYCTFSFCGDGYFNEADSSETCDDAGDSEDCDDDCTLPTCGDGHVNRFADPDGSGPLDGEECDDGANASGDGCSDECKLEDCHDGTIDNGEQCDDSNTSNLDDCVDSCMNATCGDGYARDGVTIDEACDTGADSGTCDVDCTLPVCGDTHLNPLFDADLTGGVRFEQCDVGATSTTACDAADCTFAFCGDATINAARNETCDPGSAGVTSTCDSNCTAATCGDGTFNPLADPPGANTNEQCDPSSTTTPTAICDLDCSIAFCGDGTVNSVRSEACDPGSTTTPSAGCDLDCTAVDCGDGYINSTAGEQCDDGNEVSGDGCTATTCLVEPFALSVTRAGTGSGSVASSPAGISCGTDCSEPYVANAVITLTPTLGTNSTFTGWSGACSGTGACVVTMDAAKSVTATFDLNVLTVARAGTGSGTVSSVASGINCGSDCTEPYPNNTSVTLQAAPVANSFFFGWSGGGCSGTGNCVTTMTGAKTVTATFNLNVHTLTVSRTGNGTGTVTSSPSGINCGTDCTEGVNADTVVTLTASPASGSAFTGWSGGGCSGTSTCAVTMSAAQSVVATFTLNIHQVSVAKNGNGSGTVTSSIAGIDCGTDCAEGYNSGTAVTLTATPSANNTFTGWSGACTGTGTCALTVNSAQAVTATFTLTQFALTVNRTGTGTGTVTSLPSGINCGATCVASYDNGTLVTLSAAAGGNSTFTGWSGSGCTGTGACVVTMTVARTVSANFDTDIRTLTVTTDGTGSGTVTSGPAGIDCEPTCSAPFAQGSSVTLTPNPVAGSTFTAWGGSCTGSGACVVSMNSNRSVSATFTINSHLLTVTTSGQGTVESSPAGITCGGDCTHSYTNGTVVGLVATPATGWSFSGWSNGCTGTGICSVTMTAATTRTATFVQDSYLLSVVKTGNGSGTVTSAPGGITCGGDCSESYLSGTAVVLTAAAADANNTFTGWSGPCTGTGTCSVTMDQAETAVANFAIVTRALTITKAGSGASVGTVSSTPGGISCGGDCTEGYNHGSVVLLTAVGGANNTFVGWSGGGCTGNGACVVTMSAALSVTATFTLDQFALTVTLAGTAGSVSSSPPGIACAGDCTENYDAGTLVTLTATPTGTSTSVAWTGDCVGAALTCDVTVDAVKNVTATFAP